MQGEIKEQYVVLRNISEAPGVCTLVLVLASGGIPLFAAGQFITVYFPDAGAVEGKAYSISSAPDEPSISITVRAIGEFSNRLCAMRPRDVITASLPYGYFGSEDERSSLVLLAAGIGIAPFRSIIRAAMQKNLKRKVMLFYSSRTAADTVFKSEFDALQKSNKNFTVHYFITRESEVLVGAMNRRMQPEDILRELRSADRLEFLICGSIPFVRDMWRGLHVGGIPEDAIFTEAFFSR